MVSEALHTKAAREASAERDNGVVARLADARRRTRFSRRGDNFRQRLTTIVVRSPFLSAGSPALPLGRSEKVL